MVTFRDRILVLFHISFFKL